MEAPFGITFLRKAELYNLSVELNNEYEESKKKRQKTPSVWPVVKAILKWTYINHKHLGSPIKTEHLSFGDVHNKLKDFGMLNENGDLKDEFNKIFRTTSLHKPLENIVIMGFGEYNDIIKHGHTEIVINKDGLLFGQLLAEIEEKKWFIKLHYAIYGKIMNHLGAAVLLIVSIMTVIILTINFIEKVINILKALFPNAPK